MSLQEWLTVAFLAASPVSELRGAMPVAYYAFGWSLQLSWVFSVLINALAGILVFLFLPRVANQLAHRSKKLTWFYDFLAQRALKQHCARFKLKGLMGLFIFIAIPLPLTGAWTGALLAYLFNFPRRATILTIIAAVTTAGLLVTGVIATGEALPALIRELIIGKIG